MTDGNHNQKEQARRGMNTSETHEELEIVLPNPELIKLIEQIMERGRFILTMDMPFSDVCI